MTDLYDDQQRRAEEIQRHKDNSGRLVHVYTRYTTDGQGSVSFPKRVAFGTSFQEEPRVSYGYELDEDDLAEIANIDSDKNHQVPLPLCSGGVLGWDQDENGLWVGAWVGARVYFPVELHLANDPTTGVLTAYPAVRDTDPVVEVTANIHVAHHFTFSGIGLKDVPIPQDMRDD